MATINFLYRSTKEVAPLSIRLLFRDNNTPSTVIDNETGETRNLSYSDIVLGTKIKLELSKVFWKNRNNRKAEADIKNQKVKVDEELTKVENHILRNFKKDFGIINIDKAWLNKSIESYYNPKKIEPKAFYLNYWIEYIINNADRQTNAKNSIGLSKNTIKGYRDIKNVIGRYQELETTKMISLDFDWFNDFFEWLKFEQKYDHNTAVKKVSILKTVINKASKKIVTPEGLKELDIKPIDTYDQDTDVVILTFDELEKIQSLSLESNALINARKWLLIACYTGQRGTALVTRIVKENFVQEGDSYRIEIKQIKGARKVTIPVLPVVKEIYEEGLPYKVSTQKLNIHFKQICKLAEIDEMVMGKLRNKETNRNEKKERPKYEYVSTHTGRRSFASNHFSLIPHEAIMKVTGHTKYSTFLKYVRKEDDKHLDIFTDYYKLLKEKEAAQNDNNHLKIVKNA